MINNCEVKEKEFLIQINVELIVFVNNVVTSVCFDICFVLL